MAQVAKRPLNPEQQLRKAIPAARGLRHSEHQILSVLLAKAEWVNAEIIGKKQPRSVDELADWCDMGHATVSRGIAHLVLHGWLSITKREHPGRQGRAVSYQLAVGRDCDCRKKERPAPLSGAARTRRWRLKIQPQIPVTGDGQSEVISEPIQPQNGVTCDLILRHTSAGQEPFRAKEGREEGEVERACPVCSTPMDPWLTANNYRTHVNCVEENVPWQVA
jgi:predicted transcriptional regulator